jgi:hypothetical protein
MKRIISGLNSDFWILHSKVCSFTYFTMLSGFCPEISSYFSIGTVSLHYWEAFIVRTSSPALDGIGRQSSPISCNIEVASPNLTGLLNAFWKIHIAARLFGGETDIRSLFFLVFARCYQMIDARCQSRREEQDPAGHKALPGRWIKPYPDCLNRDCCAWDNAYQG